MGFKQNTQNAEVDISNKHIHPYVIHFNNISLPFYTLFLFGYIMQWTHSLRTDFRFSKLDNKAVGITIEGWKKFKTLLIWRGKLF